MIPYYLLVGLPVLLRVIGKKYRFTIGKKVIYETQAACIDVFMLMLLMLLALRGTEVGNDTVQYLRLFQEYSSQSILKLLSTQEHELGYRLLNKLVGLLGGDYQLLLAITAGICIFPLWYFYKKESENQLLTIALFLSIAPFVMYFSGIRQAMTMSMGILCWHHAREKNLLSFVLVVLIALQLHRSAVMLFVLYPLYQARITPKWLWFVVPCMVLVYVFKTPIFNFLITFLWREYNDATETGATTVLILLMAFAVYAYVIPNEEKLDDETFAMRNLLLCSVVIQVFAMLHPLSMRFNYYLLIFLPILIPKLANRSKDKYKQIANLSVVVMTVFFFYYFINNGINGSDDLNIYPYIPFWK